MSILRNLRFLFHFCSIFSTENRLSWAHFPNFGLKTSFLHVLCQSKQFPRTNSISKIWSIIQLANWPIRWASEKEVCMGRVVSCDLRNHLHHRYWFQVAWISKNKKYFDKCTGIWNKNGTILGKHLLQRDGGMTNGKWEVRLSEHPRTWHCNALWCRLVIGY